ncbi:MAG: response regulator transcription factor [Bacteroidia bacterium]|nr:response regulator transcription factor [Bacteroidia bacterium]
MKIKCLLVDDEPLALRVVESHIEKLNDLEVVAKCRNALEAFEVIKKQRVDLMFLDIQMPGITGLDFLKNLRHRPAVVFTTAYRNYALEAFDLDVLDYLLKPISFERFFQCIQKYYQYAGSGNAIYQPKDEPHTTPESDKPLYVRQGKRAIKIPTGKIYYIESLKDYLQIHTHDEKYVVKMTLSSLENELPESSFLRIHKSFIVAIPYITALTPTRIFMGEIELPIGRNYKMNVLSRLDYK